MNTAPSADPTPKAPAGPGVVSSGWLAATSVFGDHDERRIKRAFGATVVSSVLHGAMLLIILWVLASKAAEIVQDDPPPIAGLVFLNDPGPGGGGGGSPAPAPPREIEIPPPKPAEPIPVEVPPPPVEVPPPPPPQLTAPVMTPSATIVQASGNNAVSLAAFGGGGRGRGIGPGSGDGVGPGEGGGTGGGVYGPGSGVTPPRQLKEVRPNYTSEAMRLKIQGTAVLEITILPDGTVDPGVRVVKSLDRVHGLDEEAKKAARLWLFQPARDKEGKPVAFRATLELEFRLH